MALYDHVTEELEVREPSVTLSPSS